MRIKALVVALFAVFALSAVAVSPAFAAEEETLTEYSLSSNGAGKVKATSTNTQLVDGSTKLECKESGVAGKLKEGTKLNPAEAGEITEVTWNKGAETCEGPLGVKFSVTALTSTPWLVGLIWQLIKNHNLVYGHITRVLAHLSWSGCKFLVVGLAPFLLHVNKNNPTLIFLFSKKINEEFNKGENGLTVEKVEESGLGCLGLVKNGDKPYFESEKGYETSEPTELTYEG